jgi:hypothetical protein
MPTAESRSPMFEIHIPTQQRMRPVAILAKPESPYWVLNRLSATTRSPPHDSSPCPATSGPRVW